MAIGNNNEIGKNNKLLWHIPEDSKKFKEITYEKIVVMGRNTYESIGKPATKNVEKHTSLINSHSHPLKW